MAATKPNYYEILGLNQSATLAEIRRSYRILARRYHPDMNPGKSTEERFKIIAIAYQTLSDSEKKRNYDTELESTRRIKAGFAAYEKAQNYGPKGAGKAGYTNRSRDSPHSFRSKSPPQTRTSDGESTPFTALVSGIAKISSLLRRFKGAKPKFKKEVQVQTVSVIEVSINIQDALFGGRKTVEVPSTPKEKKISLRIPAGVRSGSILRMRSGTLSQEDYVIILRIAPDPLIDIRAKGVLVDIPINISEALFGSTLSVPGLDEELTIVIPPASQSGHEIRVSNKGIKFDDGRRGDLFYRLNIQIPSSPQAINIKEKIAALSEYYENPIRLRLPKKLKA